LIPEAPVPFFPRFLENKLNTHTTAAANSEINTHIAKVIDENNNAGGTGLRRETRDVEIWRAAAVSVPEA
jgi:hypothetical protein